MNESSTPHLTYSKRVITSTRGTFNIEPAEPLTKHQQMRCQHIVSFVARFTISEISELVKNMLFHLKMNSMSTPHLNEFIEYTELLSNTWIWGLVILFDYHVQLLPFQWVPPGCFRKFLLGWYPRLLPLKWVLSGCYRRFVTLERQESHQVVIKPNTNDYTLIS